MLFNMSADSRVLSHLQCPITDQAMDSRRLAEFPQTQGIYWLYRNPQAHFLQWKARAELLLAGESQRLSQIEAEIAQGEAAASKYTLERLELLRKGQVFNFQAYREILAPLLSPQGLDVSSQGLSQVDWASGLAETLPSHQTLSSYQDNLFRDWAWNNGENEAALELIKRLWPDSLRLKLNTSTGPTEGEQAFHLTVLGSGAGRLAVDLHRHFRPQLSLLVDINPFLHLVAQRLIQGESVELYEFPHPPLSHDQAAVLHRCENPYGPQRDIHLLFADVSNLPFQRKSLDLLITPWLIDIVPEDFRAFARRLNRYLKPGGAWLNFGPLGFDRRMLSQRLCFAEVQEALTEAGFVVEIEFQERQSYLQSPHSSHGRVETLSCFRAKKVKEAKEPKRFEYLPSWLTHLDQPIPASAALAELALINKVHFEVTAIIDGQKSFRQISNLMVQSYGMTQAQADETLFAILFKIHESSLRSPGRSS